MLTYSKKKNARTKPMTVDHDFILSCPSIHSQQSPQRLIRDAWDYEETVWKIIL